MFLTNSTKRTLFIIPIFVLCVIFFGSVQTVYADTDGNELQATSQPDRLVLQLGADWAGTEFELRFDSYVFPFPS